MPPIDTTLKRWWPTTQSLDLVEGSIAQVAEAVYAEVSRFAMGERITRRWERFADLDSAFGSASEFANVPTFYLVLPSQSRWCVLWNNGFLCDGYDSLCWCLTANHGLTTMHWSAHDERTTFQSGAQFSFRRMVHGSVVERSVHCSEEDGRWSFHAHGEPLPEEDQNAYSARRKRDRLDEQQMVLLLERLGAKPWVSDFYALPQESCFVLARPEAPASIVRRTRRQVLAGS
jgi:hypothetical protein